jgi:nucleotide-binding universal stress UspA family protein
VTTLRRDHRPGRTELSAPVGAASTGRPPTRVVVGVDGSPASAGALRWAADEAARRRARLQVVRTWPLDPPPTHPPTVIDVTRPDQPRAPPPAARRAVDEVARELRGLPIDDDAVGTLLLAGDPAQVLVAVATDAALLVVGSRGAGTLHGLLLGSVSAHVAVHARCPVVVIPAGWADCS